MFRNPRFVHFRQLPPQKFIKESFVTVPLSHSRYSGSKYDVSGAKAIVGTLRKTFEKGVIQSILIPKTPVKMNKGGKLPKPTTITEMIKAISKKHDLPISEIKKQLKKGTKHEAEHNETFEILKQHPYMSNEKAAELTALNHIEEFPLYYGKQFGKFEQALENNKTQNKTMENMANGGLVRGNSHANGGVPAIDEKTGKPVAEVEGGEAVIKKTAVASDKKYQFEGKEMKPQEILNRINQDHGGNPIMEQGGSVGCGCQMADGGNVEPKPNKSQNSDWNTKISPANKFASIPKRVAFQFNPNDKGFVSLMKMFANTEGMYGKEASTGVFFDKDKKAIVCTNYHILIRFSGVETKFNGIYPVNKQSDLFKNDEGKIDKPYPDYNFVIPEKQNQYCEVDLQKMLTYCQIIERSQMFNSASQLTKFTIGEGDMFGAKNEFAQIVCSSLIKMGFDKAKFGYRDESRPMTFEVASDEYSITVLLMPMMIYNNDGYDDFIGDIDFDRGMNCVYDVKDNKVYSNLRKFTDDIDLSVKKGEILDVNPDVLNTVKKFLQKTSGRTLPILGYAKIKDNKLELSNLETSISVTGINKPDGLYTVAGSALTLEKGDIDEFPTLLDDLKYYEKVASFDGLELHEKMKIALNHVGEDELRPIMNGVHIFNSEVNGKTYIGVSDGSTAYFDELQTGILSDKVKGAIVIPDSVSLGFDLLQDKVIDVYNNEKNVCFVSGNVIVVTRKIDGRSHVLQFVDHNFLNHDVLSTKCIDIDRKQYDAAIKSIGKLENKSDKIVIKFNYEAFKGNLFIDKWEYQSDKMNVTDTGKSIDLKINHSVQGITNGFILMKMKEDFINTELIKSKLQDSDEAFVTFCMLDASSEGTENYTMMMWSPVPKFANLKPTPEKKEVIKVEKEEKQKNENIRLESAVKELKDDKQGQLELENANEINLIELEIALDEHAEETELKAIIKNDKTVWYQHGNDNYTFKKVKGGFDIYKNGTMLDRGAKTKSDIKGVIELLIDSNDSITNDYHGMLQWEKIGLSGKTERTYGFKDVIVDISRSFQQGTNKHTGFDMTIKEKNSDGSFKILKIFSGYKTATEAKNDAINKVKEVKGITVK